MYQIPLDDQMLRSEGAFWRMLLNWGPQQVLDWIALNPKADRLDKPLNSKKPISDFLDYPDN